MNCTCQHLCLKWGKPTIPFFKEIQSQVQGFSYEIIIIGDDFNWHLAENDKKRLKETEMYGHTIVLNFQA